MGTDISSYVDVYSPALTEWDQIEYTPFSDRNYGLFGFLANVNNYAECEPLSVPRGRPDDLREDMDVIYSSPEWIGRERCDPYEFSHSWFLLSELLAVDYDRSFHNIRSGYDETYRELLGPHYFEVLRHMKTLGEPDHVRIRFHFE